MSLGLVVGSCDKVVEVQPQNSVISDTGFTTRESAAAGLQGAYDAVQSTDYNGVAFPAMSDLIAREIRHVGTFTTTYGVIGQNQALPDNIQIGNSWNIIYVAINRANYLLQQSERISDPLFPKLATQAQARALRAYHYMNLLALWGGTTQGYGYPDGLGVPLRLTPTTAIGPETEAIPRSSEAEVAKAIRDDLDFAIANLNPGAGSRITKSSALALRARFELRMRNYADALSFAKLATSTQSAAATQTYIAPPPLGSTTDALWQLVFSNTDQNLHAFYWYPSPGGRNEFDPGTTIAAAHPAGDLRRSINVVTATSTVTIGGLQYTLSPGTTQKYYRTALRDDPFNVIRYAEVVLTTAEAAAQTGDLATALAQNNIIRVRAGLLPFVIGTPPTPAPNPAVAIYITPTAADPTGQAAVMRDIMLQRRLEFAYEGIYWYDLRRTNTVQMVLAATNTQTFRNLFPIPLREVQLTNGLIAQNPLY